MLMLERRCAWRGIGFELTRRRIGDEVDPDAHDLFYLGGGQDRDQQLCAQDLYDIKREPLHAAAARGAIVLGICGGIQLLGDHYELGDERVPGIGLVDLVTRRAIDGSRLIGNVAIEVELPGLDGPRVLAGFENHGGRTHLGGAERRSAACSRATATTALRLRGRAPRQRHRHLPPRPAAAQERLVRRLPARHRAAASRPAPGAARRPPRGRRARLARAAPPASSAARSPAPAPRSAAARRRAAPPRRPRVSTRWWYCGRMPGSPSKVPIRIARIAGWSGCQEYRRAAAVDAEGLHEAAVARVVVRRLLAGEITEGAGRDERRGGRRGAGAPLAARAVAVAGGDERLGDLVADGPAEAVAGEGQSGMAPSIPRGAAVRRGSARARRHAPPRATVPVCAARPSSPSPSSPMRLAAAA